MFQDPFILSTLAVLAAITGIYFGVPGLRRSERAADTGVKVAAPGCFVTLLVFGCVMTVVSTDLTGVFFLVAFPLILVPAAFILLPNLTDLVQTKLGLRVTPKQKLASMTSYFLFLILFLLLLVLVMFLHRARGE